MTWKLNAMRSFDIADPLPQLGAKVVPTTPTTPAPRGAASRATGTPGVYEQASGKLVTMIQENEKAGIQAADFEGLPAFWERNPPDLGDDAIDAFAFSFGACPSKLDRVKKVLELDLATIEKRVLANLQNKVHVFDDLVKLGDDTPERRQQFAEYMRLNPALTEANTPALLTHMENEVKRVTGMKPALGAPYQQAAVPRKLAVGESCRLEDIEDGLVLVHDWYITNYNETTNRVTRMY